MAKFCENCGVKLSFFSALFSPSSLCNVCYEDRKSELSVIERQVLVTVDITERQLELLKRQDKRSLVELYHRLFRRFVSDGSLEKKEGAVLNRFESLGLTLEDTTPAESDRRYIYAYMLKEEGKLPIVHLVMEGGMQVVLRKGEIIHFAEKAVLKELETVRAEYGGTGGGVGFEVVKGISLYAGSHGGRATTENRLITTSRGALLLTNQRLLLNPYSGYKPLSIPLNKILFYRCTNWGIEVYAEGRGYSFEIGNRSFIEILGICLGHLLGSRADEPGQ